MVSIFTRIQICSGFEALKERKNFQDLASKKGIASSQISRRVDEFKGGAICVFSKDMYSPKKD